MFVADGCFRVNRTIFQFDTLLLLQPVNQNGAILPANYGNFDFLSGSLLSGELIQHEGNQQGTENCGDEDGVNGPLIAEAVH